MKWSTPTCNCLFSNNIRIQCYISNNERKNNLSCKDSFQNQTFHRSLLHAQSTHSKSKSSPSTKLVNYRNFTNISTPSQVRPSNTKEQWGQGQDSETWALRKDLTEEHNLYKSRHHYHSNKQKNLLLDLEATHTSIALIWTNSFKTQQQQQQR